MEPMIPIIVSVVALMILHIVEELYFEPKRKEKEMQRIFDDLLSEIIREQVQEIERMLFEGFQPGMTTITKGMWEELRDMNNNIKPVSLVEELIEHQIQHNRIIAQSMAVPKGLKRADKYPLSTMMSQFNSTAPPEFEWQEMEPKELSPKHREYYNKLLSGEMTHAEYLIKTGKAMRED